MQDCFFGVQWRSILKAPAKTYSLGLVRRDVVFKGWEMDLLDFEPKLNGKFEEEASLRSLHCSCRVRVFLHNCVHSLLLGYYVEDGKDH
jgi:hypothetical protein